MVEMPNGSIVSKEKVFYQINKDVKVLKSTVKTGIKDFGLFQVNNRLLHQVKERSFLQLIIVLLYQKLNNMYTLVTAKEIIQKALDMSYKYYPADSIWQPIVSTRNQLNYLLEAVEHKNDRSRLDEIILGIYAVRNLNRHMKILQM